jgi:small-conductance mechanosensitive channel
VRYTVLVVGAVLILQNAGINLTAFAVVASALGVGIGFGLQNIISNFISGLIIMLERPIQVGDRIELAGVEGLVHSIGARRTTVVTPDKTVILVPNQRFITDNVTNYVFLNRSIRLRVPVTVAAGSDVRQVEQLLLQAARGADVRADPKPEVAMMSMSGGSIGLELWVWYDGQSMTKQQVLSRLYFAISDLLAAHGIKAA